MNSRRGGWVEHEEEARGNSELAHALKGETAGRDAPSREPHPIHSDQATQFTSWAFTRRAIDSGLLPPLARPSAPAFRRQIFPAGASDAGFVRRVGQVGTLTGRSASRLFWCSVRQGQVRRNPARLAAAPSCARAASTAPSVAPMPRSVFVWSDETG